MSVIETHKLTPNQDLGHIRQQVYNGLDTCVTLEVFEEISRLYNQPPSIYEFEKALQAPALEMMLRGIRIDTLERDKTIRRLEQQLDRLEHILATLVGIFDFPLERNRESKRYTLPNSHQQLKDFFYGRMKIPEIWSSIKGVRGLHMNRETLEKL